MDVLYLFCNLFQPVWTRHISRLIYERDDRNRRPIDKLTCASGKKLCPRHATRNAIPRGEKNYENMLFFHDFPW